LPQNIDQIEADHSALLKAYTTNNVLHAAIDVTTFNDNWGYALDQYERLHFFCSGLTTMFTNMTLVESNFSILKWEMDANHTTLMHLSLEGIFQAEQRALL
jgi:hypothetical protein